VVADLSTPDLSVPPGPDLQQPPDLAPPMVTGLPTDCTGTVNSTKLYTDVVGVRCALSNCHGGAGAPYYRIDSASDMVTKWVGQMSLGNNSMNFITAGNVNQSYVMYKVTGQQGKVVPAAYAGNQMPLGNTPLDHDELCELIQWINQGAM
jgi:hypothetical protein